MRKFFVWLLSAFNKPHLWDGSGYTNFEGIVRPKIDEEDWIESDDSKQNDPDYFKVNK